jgi:SAM-dependent methyltransferase
LAHSIIPYFEYFINQFEEEIVKEKGKIQLSGVVYTPSDIANFIIRNLFSIYSKNRINSIENLKDFLDFDDIFQLITDNHELRENLTNDIKNLRILDPSCGSGRFLICAANFLLNLSKKLYPDTKVFDLKHQIIQNNIFGIDIDEDACKISKMRLFIWLYSDNNDIQKFDITGEIDPESIFDIFPIASNIFHLDFLLEYDPKDDEFFDFIIGNPPFIENKKLQDIDYKKKLYKQFRSAYKLFDLSIVFIEKSIKILKKNGYLSFILPNKFLSADYGTRIRELLITKTVIEEILNISSLSIFQKAATYPIIISVKNKMPYDESEILIKKFKNIENFLKVYEPSLIRLPQNLINEVPSKVIPISGNIDLIKYLYAKYKTIADTFKDLKIIYRPFGFLNYSKYFDNISNKRQSNQDLLLIGTGNVGKYHIKYNKRIKIAKRDLEISYFMYDLKFEKIWKDLCGEKIIFREIAKDLTCVYDPGIFTNITGLYFMRIPSIDTNNLYCLLSILNSKLMDSVFKTLFSTLHMSGAYLRFNGSFIKRLPICNEFPEILSLLGRILQFLSQIEYNILSGLIEELPHYLDKITKYSEFFQLLNDSLIYYIFLREHPKIKKKNFLNLEKLLEIEIKLPKTQFGALFSQYDLPQYKVLQKQELTGILKEIEEKYHFFIKENQILMEINEITKEFL